MVRHSIHKQRPTRSRSSRLTRKIRKTSTVEGLQASFEKIDKKVRVMIHSGQRDSELACCIRKAWSEQFHTGLSNPAIRAMIGHYKAVHQKHQSGGMAPIQMAPMGQGLTYQSPLMKFPTELSTPAGLAGLDRTFDSSCVGKQTGGDFRDAIGNGAQPYTVPQNIFGATYTYLSGVQTHVPSGPVQSHIPHATVALPPYNPAGLSNLPTFTPTAK